MGKKATICIMSLLFGSGLLAAYHSDHRQAVQNRPAQVESQSKASLQADELLVEESSARVENFKTSI